MVPHEQTRNGGGTGGMMMRTNGRDRRQNRSQRRRHTHHLWIEMHLGAGRRRFKVARLALEVIGEGEVVERGLDVTSVRIGAAIGADGGGGTTGHVAVVRSIAGATWRLSNGASDGAGARGLDDGGAKEKMIEMS